MTRRPRSVTLVGCLFAAAGIVGLAYHGSELADRPLSAEMVWVLILRVIAVVCGVGILRGVNWARWLGIAWMAYHVVLSAFHSPAELVTHGVLLTVIAYGLFRPEASAFFGRINGLAL